MIYGIGTDIIAIARIAALWERYGEAFAKRILAADEWPSFKTQVKPVRFLAKRFAAKEALAKATGTGLRHPVSLHNISVAHDAAGRPHLCFAPELAAWLTQQGICRQHLSISDEKDIATAFVVLEQSV